MPQVSLYTLKILENQGFVYVFRGIERDECHEMDLKCFSNYKDSHSLYGSSQQNFHQNVLDSTEAR